MDATEERRTVGGGEDGEGTSLAAARNRSDWKMTLKGLFISATVIILSYNILAVTTPKPAKYSVVSKTAPVECGLKLGTRLQKMILDKHNEIRSKVAQGRYAVDDGFLPPASNMARMEWDCRLESEAQVRAEQCDLGFDSVGDKSGGRLEAIRGENAFYFRTDEEDVSVGVLKGIDRMADEISIAGINKVKLSGYDKRIGHATQIIWESTRHVGCAVHECAARQDGSLDGQQYNVAVCKYYPTGNVFKSASPTSVYTVGEAGSSCAPSFADPTTGLCVKGHENSE